MTLHIFTSIVVAVLAGAAGYQAASVALAYAAQGPTLRVLDKFATLCLTLTMTGVLVFTNTTGDLQSEVIDAVSSLCSIIALFGAIVFNPLCSHVLNTSTRNRVIAATSPDATTIEPSRQIRIAMYISGVVMSAFTALSMLL